MENIKQAVNKILKPIEEATGMPNDFYTNQEYLTKERDLILTKTWAALLLKSEFPEIGFVKPIDFLGLPLIITHTKKGEIKVFHNVCRHRGMILVEEEGPVEGVIRCKYHSWTYSIDGELKGTPNVEGFGKNETKRIDKCNFGLKEIKSGMFMNVLMVNIDGNEKPFDEHFAPLINRWQEFLGKDGFEQMSLAEDGNRIDLKVDCNWKLAVENYSESYHLPSLHPELNRTSPIDVHYNIMINEDFSGQGSNNYQDITEGKNLPKFNSWPKDKLNKSEYICIYPNLLTGVQNNYAFVILLFPESANETTEKLEIYYIGEGAESEKFESARATVLDSWTTVFSEDIEVIEGMQIGRSSPYYDGGIYAIPLEEPTHHFHKWIARKLQKSI